MGLVYCAINKANGKKYIGKTMTLLKDRITKHFSNAKKKNSKFQNALRKYGKEGFIWTTLFESNSNDELCEKEQQFIKAFCSVTKGYNITLGGEGAIGRKPWNKGVPMSEETKKKVSDNRKEIVGPRRKVICLDTNVVYESMKEAGRQLHLQYKNIQKCCVGKRNFCGSFRWAYVGKVY